MYKSLLLVLVAVIPLLLLLVPLINAQSTNMTNQQKSMAVINLLKYGTPQQKHIACNVMNKFLLNYTAAPTHQNFVDKIAALLWVTVYHAAKCDNIAGVLRYQ
jgi:predicted PurR-regulated permease PerM